MVRNPSGRDSQTIDEELASETPRFHEKLGFVFEIVQVVPLMVAPGPPPPPLILTEMDNLDLATKPPNRPPPGAVKAGSPIAPPFLGQLPPIVIEGHDITALSVDMATYGFTGRMRFRVSDSKLLGDVKDKDKVAKAFRSQNILMFKLCIRPEFTDLRGLAPLTPVMVPQVVAQVPVPVVVPMNESIPLAIQLLQQLPQELALQLQQKRMLIQQQLLVVQQQLLVVQQQRMAIMQQQSVTTAMTQTPESLRIIAKQVQLDLAENARKQQELIEQQQRYMEDLASLAAPPNNSALLAALQSIAPPGVLPPKLSPIIAPIPAVVGTPTLLEPGISPNGPLVPIEMLLTGVITSHTVSEHTSYESSDIIVSFREYCIEFSDPAQALWKEHFPIALYTRSSVSDVIKRNSNLLINVKVKSATLSVPQDQIFLALNKQNRLSERASFYDWLMWRLDETDHVLSYDYSQNIYQILERPKRPKPFQVFAADIEKIITTRPLGRFYQETLMNDSARIASTQPILNLLALSPLRQDRWFPTPTPLKFQLEYAKRLAGFSQPAPSFVVYFKRFPSRPFPPGVGIDFHLDPIDFPNNKFVIPKAAKKTNRVFRMQLNLETTEDDVLPKFKGKSTGMFRCSLSVHLQSGRDAEPRLPSYKQPHYPMEVEGIVYAMIGMPGTQIWENQTDFLTGQQYYAIQLPVFGCQQVKTPFVPNQQPGQFFFPAYRKERVLVHVYYDRSELARYLDWRPMNTLPSPVQGNQLMLGQDFTNGAKHTLVYAKDVPEYIIQRQRYSSVQFIRFYQSGIEQKSVVLTPKVDLAIQRATLAASQALEVQCMGAPSSAAGGGGASAGGGAGAPKAEAKAKVRARAKPAKPAKQEAAMKATTSASAFTAVKPPRKTAEKATPRVHAHATSRVTASAAEVSTDFTHSKQIPQTLPGRTIKTDLPRAGASRIHMRNAQRDEAESYDADVAVAQRPSDAGPKDDPGRKSARDGSHSQEGRGAGKPPVSHKPTESGGTGGELPPPPRPGTPTDGTPDQPANCRFGMDSGSGTALELENPSADAKHAILIGKEGVTIETDVAGAKAVFEQHGDSIAIRCREFTIDADQIRVRSHTHSSYQSLGQMTLSSLANMTVQTPSGLNLTAMNGLTVNALTVLINALRTIRLLGLTGGIGTFAAGPGVHSYGAEVSSTGLQNTVAGVTTKVHGASVKIGPPPADSSPAGHAASSAVGTDSSSESALATPHMADLRTPATSEKEHAAAVFPFHPDHGFAGLGGKHPARKHPPHKDEPMTGGANTESVHVSPSPSVQQGGEREEKAPHRQNQEPRDHERAAPQPSKRPHPRPVENKGAPQSSQLKQTVSDFTGKVEQAAARIGSSLFGTVSRGGPVAGQHPGGLRALAREVAQIEAVVSATPVNPQHAVAAGEAPRSGSKSPSTLPKPEPSAASPSLHHAAAKHPSWTKDRHAELLPTEPRHHRGSPRIPGAKPPSEHERDHHPKVQPETANDPSTKASDAPVQASTPEAAPTSAVAAAISAISGSENFRRLLQRGASGQSPFEVFRRLISLFSHMTWDGETPLGMLHTFQSAAAAAPRPIAEMHELLLAFQQKPELASWAPSVDSETPPEELLTSLQQYLEELGRNMSAPEPESSLPVSPGPPISTPVSLAEDDPPPKASRKPLDESVVIPGLEAASVAELLESLQTDSLDDRLQQEPTLIPTLLRSALAAQNGALTPELGAPLLVLAEAVLESRTEVAVLLAILGMAAQAGLLPSEIAGHAVAGHQLAVQSNLEVAELRAQVAQVDLPGLTQTNPAMDTTPTRHRLQPIIDFATAAADNGLLPRSSALTLAENPSSALLRLPEFQAMRAVLEDTSRITAGKPLPEERTGPLVQIRRSTLVPTIGQRRATRNGTRSDELPPDKPVPAATEQLSQGASVDSSGKPLDVESALNGATKELLVVLQAVSEGAESGKLPSGTDLVPTLLASAVSKENSGLPKELFAAIDSAIEVVLRADPKLPLLLATAGLKAKLGLLPPILSDVAKDCGRIASQHSVSAAELLDKAQQLDVRPQGLPSELPKVEAAALTLRIEAAKKLLAELGIEPSVFDNAEQFLRTLEKESRKFLSPPYAELEAKLQTIAELRMGIRQISSSYSGPSSEQIQALAPSVIGAALVRGTGVLPKDLPEEDLENALGLVLADEQTRQMVSDAQVAAESGLLPQSLLPSGALLKLWEKLVASTPDWQKLRLDSARRAAIGQLSESTGTKSDFWTKVLQFLRKVAAVTSRLVASPQHGARNPVVEDPST
jgi:hypothetical protein